MYDDNVISYNASSVLSERTSLRNCDKSKSAIETQKERATKDGRKKEISLASNQTRTNTEQRDGLSKYPAIYPASRPIRSSDMLLTSVSPLFAPLLPVYTANFTLHPDAGLFIFFTPHTFRFSLAYKLYTSPSVTRLLRVGIKKKVIRYQEEPSRFSYRCVSSGDSCTVHSR